jgi:hypothetical protein
MLLTNHVLTGSLLGLVIDNEYVLAPTAVASHLAMDMMPHFGFLPSVSTHGDLSSPLVKLWGALDFAAACVVLAAACYARPERAGHILVGAVGAALPDLTYLPEVVFGKRIYGLVPWLQRLIYGPLKAIQWYEKPPGLITETAWAGLMLWLLGRGIS